MENISRELDIYIWNELYRLTPATISSNTRSLLYYLHDKLGESYVIKY